MIKRALVLSGGGAKGAFQYGALRYIMQHHSGGQKPAQYFNIVSGVSVGALNGAMLAQNKFEKLTDLWEHISRRMVYRGHLHLFRIFWQLVNQKEGLLSDKPLKVLLEKNIALKDLDIKNCDFRFGSVSLKSGAYYSFKAGDFDKEEELVKGVLASASMPLVWPPVTEITTATGETFRQLVDGGIRNISPLGDVIDDNPGEVVIINCNSEQFTPYKNKAKNILKIARRALTEITLNEIFRQDIRGFLQINRIIQQLPEGTTVDKTDGTPYKYYRSILIEPKADLGDALDFSRKRIQQHIEMGYRAAEEAYEGD